MIHQRGASRGLSCKLVVVCVYQHRNTIKRSCTQLGAMSTSNHLACSYLIRCTYAPFVLSYPLPLRERAGPILLL